MYIRDVYLRNKAIVANLSYLSLLQIFSLFLPFVSYPYLLKTIGIEKYGIIIFASSIITYISLFINFGFNITGARDVAFYIKDKSKVTEIVSSIYLNKFILWFLFFLIYITVISIISLPIEYYYIYLFSYFLTINELLFPIWFFQAIEKMRYITLINIFIRIFFVCAIFFVVKQEADYIWVPLLNSIGTLLGGFIAVYIVFVKQKVKFSFLPKTILLHYFKTAFPVFISTLSVQIYLYVNKIAVGAFLGMSEVTIYDLGEKIANLLRIPIGMISQATFPKISRDRRISYINNVMWVSTAITIIIYFIVFFLSKWVVLFFVGVELEEAEMAIRILSVSAIFASLNVYLGGNRMIPLGYEVLYSKISVAGCLFYLFYLFILWLFNGITCISLSLNLVFVEVFVFTLFLWYDKKIKILHE